MHIPEGFRRLSRGEKPKECDRWYDDHLKEWRVVHHVAQETVIDHNSPIVIRGVQREGGA